MLQFVQVVLSNAIFVGLRFAKKREGKMPRVSGQSCLLMNVSFQFALPYDWLKHFVPFFFTYQNLKPKPIVDYSPTFFSRLVPSLGNSSIYIHT